MHHRLVILGAQWIQQGLCLAVALFNGFKKRLQNKAWDCRWYKSSVLAVPVRLAPLKRAR